MGLCPDFSQFTFWQWVRFSVWIAREAIEQYIWPRKPEDPSFRLEHIHRNKPILLTSLVPSRDLEKPYQVRVKPRKLQSSRFLQLPLEIRIQILEYILHGSDPVFLKLGSVRICTNEDFFKHVGRYRSPFWQLKKWPLKRTYRCFVKAPPTVYNPLTPFQDWLWKMRPSVMRCCRQLYDEGLPILYGSNSFALIQHSPYALHRPRLFLEPVQELHRFGGLGAFCLIQNLTFYWPLTSELHNCEQCQMLWNYVWNTLRAMERLRYLDISFLTDFKDYRGHLRPLKPDLWREEGADWLKTKLLSVNQVREFRVVLSESLAWMRPEMELDPNIFKVQVRAAWEGFGEYSVAYQTFQQIG